MGRGWAAGRRARKSPRRFRLFLLLALAIALLTTGRVDAQDRSGILGGGISFYGISGGGAGLGYHLELAANMNRVHAPLQYRLSIAYGGFREDEPVPACGLAAATRCPTEPLRHEQFSIGFAPTLAAADRGPIRLRLAPLGAAVLVRHTAARALERQRCMPASAVPGCEDGHRTFDVTDSSVEFGYGLRSGIELGLHLRPVVVQLAARWQHSLGEAPGYVAVPVTIGYFF